MPPLAAVFALAFTCALLNCALLLSTSAVFFGGTQELVDKWLDVMGYTPVSSLLPLACGSGSDNDSTGGDIFWPTGGERGSRVGGVTASTLGGGSLAAESNIREGVARLLLRGNGGGALAMGSSDPWGDPVGERFCPLVSMIQSIVPVMLVLFPAVHGPLAVLAAWKVMRLRQVLQSWEWDVYGGECGGGRGGLMQGGGRGRGGDSDGAASVKRFSDQQQPQLLHPLLQPPPHPLAGHTWRNSPYAHIPCMPATAACLNL